MIRQTIPVSVHLDVQDFAELLGCDQQDHLVREALKGALTKAGIAIDEMAGSMPDAETENAVTVANEVLAAVFNWL